LYSSNHKNTEISIDDNSQRIDINPTPIEQGELNSQITEKALIPYLSKRDKIRSQTTQIKTENETIAEQTNDDVSQLNNADQPNKENNDSDYDEKKIERSNDKNIKNKTAKIISQTIKTNIIESRELLFLHKDNFAYFVDIHGKPLDSGS